MQCAADGVSPGVHRICADLETQVATRECPDPRSIPRIPAKIQQLIFKCRTGVDPATGKPSRACLNLVQQQDCADLARLQQEINESPGLLAVLSSPRNRQVTSPYWPRSLYVIGLQARLQGCRSHAPTPHPNIPLGSPCVHLRGPINNRLVVNNAQDLYIVLRSNYGTGKPIEITKVVSGAPPNTYAVILAGTEFKGNQANTTNLSGIDSLMKSGLDGLRGKIVNAALNPAGTLADVINEPQIKDFVLNQIDPDFRSSLGKTTMFQAQILRAMKSYGIPAGANIILVGHSLGGMDAQNLVNNPQFNNSYHALEVITYGSPLTTADSPAVKYVRYSAPTDIVPFLSPTSLLADRSKWIFVNNPGQNPAVPVMFRRVSPGHWQVLPGFGDGIRNAHLNYGISADLAQYDALLGTRNISTSLLLDAIDDKCYPAPDTFDKPPGQ